MATFSSFGAWLKQRRKLLDLTQEQLACKVGWTTSLLQKNELGERRPSRQIVESLADALASTGIFVMRCPEHLMSRTLRQIAATLLV